MSAGTQSVGSLVIDLRANVAQLRSDMDEVKNTIAKSSREMSSQMKSDMNETRQVLALMRDDFGVGIPRELRKTIAESELARTAILGIKDALFGIAFLNLGLEAFNKLSTYLSDSSKKADEEAKHTRDIAIAAQDAVDATVKRAEKLELIGKGEEERAALQKKFFQEELTQNQIRLATLQAQINAKVVLMNLDAAAAASPDVVDDMGRVVGKGSDKEAGDKAREEGLQAIMKLAQDLKPQIEAANKAISDALIGLKTNAVQLADYEKGLGIERINNEKNVALARISLEESTAKALMNMRGADLAEDVKAMESAADERYQIELDALNKSIAILQQDPSRNKEKIEADLSAIQVLWYKHQQELVQIYAENTAKITAINDKEFGELLKMTQPTGKSGTQQGAADFEAQTKREAELGRVRKEAIDALLTPTDKYRQELVLIQAAMVGWDKFPNVMKALNDETLRLNPEFQKLQQYSAELGKDMANEIEQMAINGKSLHDVFLSLIADLEKMVLEWSLLGPLQKFFKGGDSGTGGFPGFLAGIFGLKGSSGGGGDGLGGLSPGDFLAGIPAFAYGGSATAGQVSLVGENGPELLVPNSNSTIVPNGSVGGVTQVFNIDARGAAPGAEAAIIRGLQKALEQNRQQSIAGAVDYQRRR